MTERFRSGLRLTPKSSSEADAEAAQPGHQEFFDLAPDLYIITDNDGRIRGCNVAAATLFGISQPSLTPVSLPSFIEAGYRREFRLQMGNVRRGGTTVHWRSELLARDGSTVPIAISAAPILASPHAAGGLRWMIRDDSAHEAAQSRLLQVSEELASRAAEQTAQVGIAARLWADVSGRGRHRTGAGSFPSYVDLLGMVSHEIRTPVAAAHGFIERLRRGAHGDLTPIQHGVIDSIAACHEHLLRVLDNALAVARLDSGHLDLALAHVPVDTALQDLQACMESDCEEKGVRYAYHAGAPAALVLADRAKLHQIMLNLLTNAVKFTPAGGTVTVSWESAGPHVAITVRDTGIGIPSGDLERVFEPYVQVTRPGAEEVGTGLGLAISRKLARAMGGDVTVVSTTNVGSTFTLTLPRAGRTTP